MVVIPVESEKEIEQRTRIYTFIEKYFDYSKKSLEYIKEQLFRPEIDESYAKFFTDDTLRRTIEIPIVHYEKNDKGWSLFKNFFPEIINDYSITYENFFENSFMNGKNKVKLFKFITSLISEKPALIERVKRSMRIIPGETSDNILKRAFEEIGKLKISAKGSFKIILSCNIADYLLASTGEKWGSCINMESNHGSAYCTGLPSLLGDKSRSLIYETTGGTKEYAGIKTDSFVSRTWSFLDSKDRINLTRFYPEQHFTDETISKGLDGAKVIQVGGDGGKFKSKHKIIPLFNTQGFSQSIYVDHLHLSNDLYYESGGAGFQTFHETMPNPKMLSRSLYSFSSGFTRLMNEGQSIGKYANAFTCGNCNKSLKESKETVWGDFGDDNFRSFCVPCHKKLFIKCSCCDTGIIATKSFSYNGEYFCNSCRNEKFEKCASCSSYHKKQDIKEYSYYDKEDSTIYEDWEEKPIIKTKMCLSCASSFFKKRDEFICTTCGENHSNKNNNFVYKNKKYYCFDCHADTYQLKFEFVA